ncbi:MAG: extracellular solute-binding protein [Phycisphaerales bacterium]|nr:extracellular solute-binding protein [Phycisphaerales bacterium]
MLSSEISRRTLLAALVTAGAGFSVWPRKPRGRAAAPPGRVVLTYWEKWTGPEALTIQNIVDRYNAAQSRVWVQRVTVSEIREKAMLAIAGGDPPDIVGLYSYNIPNYAEAGAFIPLSEFAGRGALPEDHYAPGVWKLLTHEGRHWAGVNGCFSFAFYYNRGHFRDVGLNPDAPPRTVAELDQCAERLTRYDANGRLQQIGFLPSIPSWWPHIWPVMFGGRLFDATTNRATLTDAACVAAYEWVRSWPGRFRPETLGGIASSFEGAYHTAQDPFLSQRVSMIAQGPWMANFRRTYAPSLDFGVVPLPPIESLYDSAAPVGMLECDILAIPRGCRHPEEAYAFLRFTQSREMQELLAIGHCKPSPLREQSADFAVSHPNPFVAVHGAILNSPRAQIAPQTRVWPEFTISLENAFDAIWAGDDVRRTLGAVNRHIQQKLDRAAERREKRRGRSSLPAGAPA